MADLEKFKECYSLNETATLMLLHTVLLNMKHMFTCSSARVVLTAFRTSENKEYIIDLVPVCVFGSHKVIGCYGRSNSLYTFVTLVNSTNQSKKPTLVHTCFEESSVPGNEILWSDRTWNDEGEGKHYGEAKEYGEEENRCSPVGQFGKAQDSIAGLLLQVC